MMNKKIRHRKILGFLRKINVEHSTMDRICEFLGETIGTALLVFLGCTGCAHDKNIENSPILSQINIALVVIAMVQCFGCVSGAHLNPAITLAVYVYDMISFKMTIAYFIAQILGAYLGYGLMLMLIPPSAISWEGAAHSVCIPSRNPDITVNQAFCIEFIITALVIFTTCSAADARNAALQDSMPIRFGIVIVCAGLTAGPLTGANINPAKALAAATWMSDYENLWLYCSAPMSGAAVSSIFYKLVFKREFVDTNQMEKVEQMSKR
ncbi:aquaporin AQPcic-like isoform X2 [Eurosta solidaginis]|uniref:aquaporin AQPcic-like isoform X2 n=1 Tax=Eurosta solidaginis TaxID=178769 RepID=UPI0035307E7D